MEQFDDYIIYLIESYLKILKGEMMSKCKHKRHKERNTIREDIRI